MGHPRLVVDLRGGPPRPDAYYREWSARVAVLRAPRDEDWGARTFDLLDPVGEHDLRHGTCWHCKEVGFPAFRKKARRPPLRLKKLFVDFLDVQGIFNPASDIVEPSKLLADRHR